MIKQIAQLLALFAASLGAVAVVYYKIPSGFIQQSIAVFVVVLLIISRFVFSRNRSVPFLIRLALITLVAAFLQLLVFSSGGFYSPFLILFHLFTIGISFLFSVRIATGFLAFSITALIASSLLDNRLHNLFLNDPWSALLYLLSFAVIIPLYQLVSNSYHLEEAISRILTVQLALTKKRYESLLGGLSDLVIVTDANLRVLSVNEATIRALKISSTGALGLSIFDLVYLKSLTGLIVDRQFLSIDEVIGGGTAHIINDLLLYTKNAGLPKKVNVGVHPTRNLEGQIDQVVFIISNFYSGENPNIIYRNIEQAALRHKSLLQMVKQEMEGKNLNRLRGEIDLLGKTEEDILVATEIIGHGIKPNFSLMDTADLMQHIVANEKSFAEGLGIPLEFSLSREFIEQFTIDLRGKTVPVAFTSKYFTVLVEPRWFDFLMEKVLNLSIFLSIREQQPKVEVLMSYGKDTVKIDVACIYRPPIPKDFEKLLQEGNYSYTSPGTDINMTLGSGLENYLIKTITTLLNIPFSVVYNPHQSMLYFTVQLSRTPI